VVQDGRLSEALEIGKNHRSGRSRTVTNVSTSLMVSSFSGRDVGKLTGDAGDVLFQAVSHSHQTFKKGNFYVYVYVDVYVYVWVYRDRYGNVYLF
jgi:hypothetical protein